MAPAALSDVFTLQRIERLAGLRAYDRTLPYSVALWVEGSKKAAYECSCPQGDEDKFCKHAAGPGTVALRSGSNH